MLVLMLQVIAAHVTSAMFECRMDDKLDITPSSSCDIDELLGADAYQDLPSTNTALSSERLADDRGAPVVVSSWQQLWWPPAASQPDGQTDGKDMCPHGRLVHVCSECGGAGGAECGGGKGAVSTEDAREPATTDTAASAVLTESADNGLRQQLSKLQRSISMESEQQVPTIEMQGSVPPSSGMRAKLSMLRKTMSMSNTPKGSTGSTPRQPRFLSEQVLLILSCSGLRWVVGFGFSALKDESAVRMSPTVQSIYDVEVTAADDAAVLSESAGLRGKLSRLTRSISMGSTPLNRSRADSPRAVVRYLAHPLAAMHGTRPTHSQPYLCETLSLGGSGLDSFALFCRLPSAVRPTFRHLRSHQHLPRIALH